MIVLTVFIFILQLTDEAVNAVAENCPELKSFDIHSIIVSTIVICDWLPTKLKHKGLIIRL